MKHYYFNCKMIFRLIMFATIVANWSVSCNPIATAEAPYYPTAIAISNATPTGSSTILPTLPALATSAPTLISQSSRFTTDCINISDSALPDQMQLNGTLVLSEVDGTVYLLNLETGKKTPLVDAFEIAVSPDRSKLAYNRIRGDLIISDKYGNKLKSIPDPRQQLSPAQWLDNERLAMSSHNQKASEPFALDTLILLNPFTGEKQEILPEYPDINTFFPPTFQWEGYFGSRIVPNPNLTRIIYPAISGNLILWDMPASRVVKSIYRVDDLNTPWWSPDGTQFITSIPIKFTDSNGESHININDGLPYNAGNELVVVNQLGEIKRLTYLTTKYNAKEFHYNWSPDGQKVAFWLQLDKNTDSQFSVANVNTGEVTDYCLSTIDGGARTVWSKDGIQLALSSINGDQQTVLIVDLQLHAAIKIAEKASVLGWMK